MKVRELAQWLSAFEDQDAEVVVVRHLCGTGYYDQDGTATAVKFDPKKHVEYEDLRGNPHITPDKPYYNERTLLLGVIDG